MLAVSVMAHPRPEEVKANVVPGGGAWLRFAGEGYTSVDIHLAEGVADAIARVIAPFVTGGVE
jgi:hypothetical protein